MTEAEMLLTVESRKKSGAIAALLNLFLPGAGYMYCGRWVLGIVAFIFVVTIALVSFDTMAIPLWIVLIADGLLCANRYNKKIIQDVLSQAKSSAN